MSTSPERKSQLKMSIHVGMLESLGVNMYTSIGQSLIEFIANGFDADATKVFVQVPFSNIENERKKIRAKAKSDGLDLKQGVYDPLPETVEISVSDDGHGMTVEEMEDKFLVLSRNRRKAEDGEKSESGHRTVMGRKGLGKLAGFGAAQKVIIRTKRKGETYATTIEMDFEKISAQEQLGNIKFTPSYEEGLPEGEKGTKITLQHLRCDSIKATEKTLYKTLVKNFSHFGDGFDVYLGTQLIKPPKVDYEFIYPEEEKRTNNGLAEFEISVEDEFIFPVLGSVSFRRKGDSDEEFERGHLPATERGARIYCNGRLAAGPTLFDLPTGMHNFHAQSYLECVIHADVLDQLEADLISTNRQGFKTDNIVVSAFIAGVTDLMKKAIAAHSKYRDKVVEEEVNNDPDSQVILRSISGLNSKIKRPAEKILRIVAAQEGTASPIYKEIAPHLVQAINSSEVLADLIHSVTDPKDFVTIIGQLAELSEIERSDVLKLYRGRRNGIHALQKLEERSQSRGPQYEKELHQLLKENPWLIKPEYSNYLTSDTSMGDVAKKLTKALKIDMAGDVNSTQRPDLVFLALDSHDPHHVTIVELKSPDVPLNADHLTQLEGYIAEVESILEQDYDGRKVGVQGHLIGNMPKPDTSSSKAKTLIKKKRESGPSQQWEILSIPTLLARTRNVHMDGITSLEKEEESENT